MITVYSGITNHEETQSISYILGRGGYYYISSCSKKQGQEKGGGGEGSKDESATFH